MLSLEIDVGKRGSEPGYPIVARGPGGTEASGVLSIDAAGLLARRADLQNSIIASTVPAMRGHPGVTEAPVRTVGQLLFTSLIRDHVYGQYSAARALAATRGEPLRIVLRISTSELACLPWEMLYDEEHDAYLCKEEPLIRHVAAPTPPPPTVAGRLRVLGLVAAPSNLAGLAAAAEKALLEEALSSLRERVELRWASSGTWGDLRRTLTEGPWHVVHFIGHGDVDETSGRGRLALEGEDGRAHWILADRIRDLISIQSPPPRLVVLNSCSSGETAADDLFSSTAATLVRGGACAVVAMQYAITDEGAKAFAESLYQAIASNHTISESVRIARIGIAGPDDSLEWATPVLYLRGDDAQDSPLFSMTAPVVHRPGPDAVPAAPPPRDHPAGDVNGAASAARVPRASQERRAAPAPRSAATLRMPAVASEPPSSHAGNPPPPARPERSRSPEGGTPSPRRGTAPFYGSPLFIALALLLIVGGGTAATWQLWRPGQPVAQPPSTGTATGRATTVQQPSSTTKRPTSTKPPAVTKPPGGTVPTPFLPDSTVTTIRSDPPMPVRVKAVVAGVRTRYEGQCPPDPDTAPYFRLTLTVSHGPATVQYRWRTRNGASSDPSWHSAQFPGSGEQVLVIGYTHLGYLPDTTVTDWVAVDVTEPYGLQSNRVDFTTTCVSPGP